MIVSGQSYPPSKSAYLASPAKKVPLMELEEPLFGPCVIGPQDGYSSGSHAAATMLGISTSSAASDDYAMKIFGASTARTAQYLNANPDEATLGPCLNRSRASQSDACPVITTDPNGYILIS